MVIHVLYLHEVHSNSQELSAVDSSASPIFEVRKGTRLDMKSCSVLLSRSGAQTQIKPRSCGCGILVPKLHIVKPKSWVKKEPVHHDHVPSSRASLQVIGEWTLKRTAFPGGKEALSTVCGPDGRETWRSWRQEVWQKHVLCRTV